MPSREIRVGEALDLLREMPDNSVDSVVTDPPAGIEFMGLAFDTFKRNKRSKAWAQQGKDGGPGYGGYGMKLRPAFHTQGKGERDAFVAAMTDIFAEALRVLKPGGYALVWAIPRTSHWMAWALEGAGFEVRDCVYHTFLSGFPKSHGIGEAIEKIDADAAKDWYGWETALKPAVEQWWLCRKPLSEKNLALNVLKWGTGGLNVGESRIAHDEPIRPMSAQTGGNLVFKQAGRYQDTTELKPEGRWPSHLVLSHHPDCVEVGERKVRGSDPTTSSPTALGQGSGWNAHENRPVEHPGHADADGNETLPVWACHPDCAVRQLERQRPDLSRFFFVAKPGKRERDAGLGDAPDRVKHRVNPGGIENDPRWAPVVTKNNHPTLKAVGLMEYLVRLVTPPDGTVLDPFCGSGTTGMACSKLGFGFVGIDREPEYAEIARARIAHAEANGG